ncbi:pickpocket protein 28-like isoform X2 [Homalodisca vitripennis]|nr:pickpocket protein 28-like isoform X2 [Homalodisca vitripennis]
MKGENSLQLETPESLLNDGQHHGRNVPLPWWEHVPGGTKIKDYFASTSLHGLKYFSEPSRLVERFYWIIAMVVVYVGLISSLYDQSKLFLNSPVLMSLDSSTTPVWDIPFPAVTICSENQVRPSFFNYSDYKTRTNMTKRELEVFEYLTMVCDYNATESGLNFFSTKALDEVHYDIWDRCSDTLALVWLNNYVPDVCSMIQPVLTPSGACHTFNSLPGNRLFRESIFSSLHNYGRQVESIDDDIIWSPDRGYRGKKVFNSTPWRIRGGGSGQDATFMLNLNVIDFDDTCFFGSHGFEVILHSPAELPTPSHPSTYVHADRATTIKIVPEIKTTKEELRRWDPKLRGCFFDDERPLQYFQYYTEKNCDLECESNASLSRCGCVPFYHPRTRDTPVCGPEKYDCCFESIAESIDPDSPSFQNCNCLPACFEIEYRISVANFQRNFSTATAKGFQSGIFSGNFPENNFALVTVQYQTQKVIAQMRVAVFSFTDFIANIGGLLGLFLGFSFLSLFEIIYFFVLKYYKKRSNKRTDTDN